MSIIIRSVFIDAMGISGVEWEGSFVCIIIMTASQKKFVKVVTRGVRLSGFTCQVIDVSKS